MRSPVCYLAQPVDIDSTVAPAGVDYVRSQLEAVGFVVYSPARAFTCPPKPVPGPAIHRINQFALAECDALVALFPERRTIGVPMELQQAISLEMPSLVLTFERSRSWTLAGLPEWARVVAFPGADSHFTWLMQQTLELLDEPRSHGVRVREPMYMRVDEQGQLPTRAYSGDAGFDLYCQIDWTIQPDATADIPCGVAVQLPDRVWGLIVGRSSTLRRHNLLVSPGIIDTGWRGQLFAGVRNLGTTAFEVKRGMRLAQFIPLPNLAAGLVPTPVEQLSPSDRGEAGFGSSGE
jgi:dUTP pyrophosphatase